MIENCLSHKIVRDFLKNHPENKWKDLIPLLIEIGILYLQNKYDKVTFTFEELKKFSINLQHKQIEKDKERSKEKNKEINIYDSLNTDTDKEEKKVIINKEDNNINNYKANEQKLNLPVSNKNNQEKLRISNDAIKEMKNNIKNNYQFFKNNISNDFKNKLNKQKQEHFKKINFEKNRKKEQKQKDKISYAISYDKNLIPSSISKKINNTTNNNTNIKTDYTTNPNNLFYNSSYNHSSEKKFKNLQSKSKSKNKNKEKYLNLNLNGLGKIGNIKNKEIKNYSIGRQIVKNNLIRIGGNEKPNYYKKLNNIIKKCNLLNNEHNLSNNYDAINNIKRLDKMSLSKNVNSSNSYGQNYFKNSNLISTLYQRLNSNDRDLKNINNYFSNRDELEKFINKNRVDNNKLNDKSEKNNSKHKKNIIKSEKPFDRNNSFMKLEENEIEIKKKLEKDKNKSTKSLKKKVKDKENLKESLHNVLLKSLPSKQDLLKIEKNDGATPKKIYIKTEKETISSFKNNIILKEFKDKKEIDNTDKKEGLKIIKLFDIKAEEKKEPDDNKENNPFLKNISKNRYVNMFGHEGEVDFSLTQIEKDCSGIFDSSISNENQINPENFFKESPKNIFKNDKSDEQSINSKENKI